MPRTSAFRTPIAATQTGARQAPPPIPVSAPQRNQTPASGQIRGPGVDLRNAQRLGETKPPPRVIAPIHNPAPTSQREFKSGEGLADVVLQEPSGRYVTTRRERSPIDVHAKSFTEEELFYAALYIRDAEVGDARPPTAAYDGMPRQVSGPRAGGVADKLRMAHNRYTYIQKHLESEFKHVAKWLLEEVRRESTGSTASVADIGHELTGIRDKAMAKGVGIGALKGAIWSIKGLYQKMRDYDDRRAQVEGGPYLVPRKGG